jgi:hypothetical protein
MNLPEQPTTSNSAQVTRAKNLSYALVAGQSGCLNILIIIGALLLGIWLDAQFGLRGPFTIFFLLASIPLSLFFMVRIALGSVKMIKPQQTNERKPQISRAEEDNL